MEDLVGEPQPEARRAHMIEQRVVDTLRGLGAEYELIQIDPAYADTAAFCEKYGYPMEQSGNTIIVGSRKEPRQFSACLVLAHTKLDVNHAVRGLMGVSRLSFATAEDTMTLTGMMIGGVTVLALPTDLPIYVDERVMALDWVILGSGSRSSKIKTPPDTLRRLPNARVVPALALGP
jgi:prolyl-tRNA editing enzyme YbaK/EbsC (Cys-tRNA(Pro) deacylase)